MIVLKLPISIFSVISPVLILREISIRKRAVAKESVGRWIFWQVVIMLFCMHTATRTPGDIMYPGPVPVMPQLI
jgi:hypothetical protein